MSGIGERQPVSHLGFHRNDAALSNNLIQKIEFYLDPSATLGWSQVPHSSNALKHRYIRRHTTLPGPWRKEPISPQKTTRNTWRWAGLDAGRYRLNLIDKPDAKGGYRSLVVDMRQNYTIDVSLNHNVTILLPKPPTKKGLHVRAVNTISGDTFWGGPNLAGSTVEGNRVQMNLPQGPYCIALYLHQALSYCTSVAGEFQVRDGNTIDLTFCNEFPSGTVQFLTPKVVAGAPQSIETPKRTKIGTVYQFAQPVMPVFRDSRERRGGTTISLPSGEFEWRPVNGSPIPFAIENRQTTRISIPTK